MSEQEQRVLDAVNARISAYLAGAGIGFAALRDSPEQCRGLVWATVRHYEERLAQMEATAQALRAELEPYSTCDGRRARVKRAVLDQKQEPRSTSARAWRATEKSGRAESLRERIVRYVRERPGVTRAELAAALRPGDMRALASCTARCSELIRARILREDGEVVGPTGLASGRLFIREEAPQ